MKNKKDNQKNENLDYEKELATSEVKVDKKDQLNLLKQQNQDLKNKIMMLLADIENNRKIHNKEIENIRKFASTNLILEIINALATFDLALNISEDKKTPEVNKFLKGFEMIYHQLEKLIENQGVKTFIPQIGDKFNSEKHEIFDEIISTQYLPEHITKIYKKGYIMYDRVIQHALVQIAKVNSKDENKSEALDKNEEN